MLNKAGFFPVLLFIVFSISQLNAQPLSVQWQKSFGGELNEFTGRGRQSLQTIDGGFVLAGQTESQNNGNVGSNKGALDFWVVKTDEKGNIQWQKTYGGDNLEYATAIQQTNDSGYVVVGYTNSNNNGEVGINQGGFDIWIIKLDVNGNLLWQKTLGGTNDDFADAVVQCSDNGFLIAGNTLSDNSGDVGSNHGLADGWIIKLTATGIIEWQKIIGGDNNDIVYDLIKLSSGNYIISGYTQSNNNGDIGINHGAEDFWVTLLDESGNMIWSKTFGGDLSDVAYSIQQTNDLGFVVAGYTTSNNNGDVGTNRGESDVWIIKIDSLGIIQWQKTLGGNNEDVATTIKQSLTGDCFFAGYTRSDNNGDVGINNGEADGWIVKLDSSGTLIWQMTTGGFATDIITGINQTTSGGLILSGDTYSDLPEGNSHNHGHSDYWLQRLEEPASIKLLVSTGPFCPGDTLKIGYQLNGFFASNNNLIIELSDKNGSFAAPDTISIVSTSTSGNINSIISSNLEQGSGYRIRIVSSDPFIISAINNTDLNINNCNIALQLKMFIQGFYLGNGRMQPVLYTNNLTNDSLVCDTITIELHDALNPTTISANATILLYTNGTANIGFPPTLYGNAYYISIRHRNSIETWSKSPLTFIGKVVSYDFSGN